PARRIACTPREYRRSDRHISQDFTGRMARMGRWEWKAGDPGPGRSCASYRSWKHCRRSYRIPTSAYSLRYPHRTDDYPFPAVSQSTGVPTAITMGYFHRTTRPKNQYLPRLRQISEIPNTYSRPNRARHPRLVTGTVFYRNEVQFWSIHHGHKI